MSMVFCRGCAKEIDQTAITCPGCGAPQTSNASTVTTTAGEVSGFGWYVEGMKKYATFTGRARRKEYWMFFLFNVIIAAVLGFIEALVGGPGILSNLYSLVVLLPGIAVGIRRMHDTDRSGWWILVPIANIVFLATEGQRGDNRFGSDPKKV